MVFGPSTAFEALLPISSLRRPCPLQFCVRGSFCRAAESYWFYWRVWFLSEAVAFLTLAPAILTWIAGARTTLRNATRARCIEAGLIGCGLVAISVRVFNWPMAGEGNIPALVYLPLPFLLWAAVRFGPAGVNTSLLIVAILSISGAVRGRGPFAATIPADDVLALQLFLITISIPLMLLAALIAERRARTNVLRESEARFRSMADTAPVLIWMSDADKLCTFLTRAGSTSPADPRRGTRYRLGRVRPCRRCRALSRHLRRGLRRATGVHDGVPPPPA